MQTNVFVDLGEDDFNESHDQKLKGTSFAQNSPERDEDSGCSEVCRQHSVKRELYSDKKA